MYRKFTTIKASTHTKGYIALLSTIIIGAVLLTITVSAGQSGWYTRFTILGTEAKFQSHAKASGCINQALALFLVNPAWNGDITTVYDDGSCYIYPIQKNYSQPQFVTIKVRGEVRGAVTNLESEFNMAEIHLDAVPKTVPSVPPLSSTNVLPARETIFENGVMP